MPAIRKERIPLVTSAVVLVILLVGAFWYGLVVRRYTLDSRKLTNPVRLLVLTDLHSTMYGKNQSILLAKIRELKPDLVLLVGDIVDDKRPQESALQLLQALGSEYPCFYVTGNHEFWSGKADEIKDSIRSFGITVLEGNCKTVEVRGQRIQICGVDDPDGFEEKGSLERKYLLGGTRSWRSVERSWMLAPTPYYFHTGQSAFSTMPKVVLI